MLKPAATSCNHLAKLGDKFISGLSEADVAAQPSPGGKTAGWLIGHLAITGDFVRRKLGRPPLTPKEWGPLFGPGTQPSNDASYYPPLADLRSAFKNVYADLASIAPDQSGDVLGGPNPFEPVRDRLPTMGDFATWIMTGHLGYHLGQLAELRAGASRAFLDGTDPKR